MASPISVKSGDRFDRLVAVEMVPRGKSMSWWRVRCDCGTEKVVRMSAVTRGDTRSCGCLIREITAARSRSHGKSRDLIYQVWTSLVKRCCNPKTSNFADYGGRGITVCDRWRNSFEAFLEDMGPRPSPKHSIDRIDNDGNYEPGNCRWATWTVQARNRRGGRLVEIDGEVLPLKEAAERHGVPYHRVHRRIQNGWALTDALGKPVSVIHSKGFRKCPLTPLSFGVDWHLHQPKKPGTPL